MGLAQCRSDPCRFYLKEARANGRILGCPVWPLLVRFRLLIVFAGHTFSHTADALSSMIKPIQVVLPHRCDQLVGVIRGGGVTGLVELAGECVRISLELALRPTNSMNCSLFMRLTSTGSVGAGGMGPG
jgi:hypothetical protein